MQLKNLVFLFFLVSCGDSTNSQENTSPISDEDGCVTVNDIPICQCQEVSFFELPSCLHDSVETYLRGCCECVVEAECTDESIDSCTELWMDKKKVLIADGCIHDICSDRCRQLKEYK